MKLTQDRYKLQNEYRKTYEDSLDVTKQDISKKFGVPLSEEIGDEIRNWFKDTQTRTGKFPDFPSEDNGGSRHLLSRQGIISDFTDLCKISLNTQV